MRHVEAQLSGDDVKPLTEPVFCILLSLANQPLHGYGLIKDIEKLSNGRVKITTGTLYGAIGRLLQDEWIKPVEQADSPRDRQAYALTPLGRRRLLSEIQRLKQLTNAAASRLREA